MNFDPKDHEREPREKGWKEETEAICEMLKQRGDMRIGQLLINVVEDQFVDQLSTFEQIENDMSDEDVVEEYERRQEKRKARIERILWSLEADELAEAMEEYLKSMER